MTARLSPVAKLALDFAPLAVFFVAFRVGGVMTATVALIVATLISILVIYIAERKIAMAPLVSGILVTILGGLSIALHDEQFIKMKPTFVNLAFSGTLLVGAFWFKKGLLKHVLDIAFQLTPEGWIILSKRWGYFFLFLAILNEVIWRTNSTSFWVDFKVFGMFTLTALFAAFQVRLIEKYKAAPLP